MANHQHLRQFIRAILREGGLKLPPDKRSDLNSSLVIQASKAYVNFISGWNRWLESNGKDPVKPIAPTGSSAHAEQNAAENQDAVYGDVDYLVSFPLSDASEDFGERRKAQAAVEREYTELMGEYIRTVRPAGVDVELTLKPNSIPSQVVLELPSGEFIQVDTVVTFPEFAEWMKGRYVPERGIKGYIAGKLYNALGNYFTLTIGTQGVIARLKDGVRVTSKQRAGVKYHKISDNFRNFLVDIAQYLVDDDVELDPKLKKYPGFEPGTMTVEDFAHGITGLANTLANAGVVDKHTMLTTIMSDFEQQLFDAVERNTELDATPEKIQKMRKLNDEQIARVERVLGI